MPEEGASRARPGLQLFWPLRPHALTPTTCARSLGRHLLQAFAVKPNSTVIAAVRNPKAVKDELDSLSNSLPNGSRIIVVKIDSASQPDVVDAVKEIQAQGIDKIDVVRRALCQRSHSPVCRLPGPLDPALSSLS